MMTASVVMFTAMAVGREYPEHLKLAANVREIVRQFNAPTTNDVPQRERETEREDDLPF